MKNILEERKKVYFCSPNIFWYDKTDFSAIPEKEDQQAWIQVAHGHRQRQESACRQKGKRKEKTDHFR